MMHRAIFVVALSFMTAACDVPPTRAQGTVPDAKRTPPGGDSASETPSQKLDRSRGVIVPRADVDPKMQVKPPDPGPTSTPVIPPPGSSGGDPKVIPK